MKTSEGKQVSFGKTLNWKLPPLVKEETMSGIDKMAQLWLVMICIALFVSVIIACMQGSLV